MESPYEHLYEIFENLPNELVDYITEFSRPKKTLFKTKLNIKDILELELLHNYIPYGHMLKYKKDNADFLVNIREERYSRKDIQEKNIQVRAIMFKFQKYAEEQMIFHTLNDSRLLKMIQISEFVPTCESDSDSESD